MTNPSVFEKIFKEYRLTGREIDVVNLFLWEGLSTKGIAERLCISSLTVRDHTINIYKKFDLSGRTELLSFFLRKLAGV